MDFALFSVHTRLMNSLWFNKNIFGALSYWFAVWFHWLILVLQMDHKQIIVCIWYAEFELSWLHTHRLRGIVSVSGVTSRVFSLSKICRGRGGGWEDTGVLPKTVPNCLCCCCCCFHHMLCPPQLLLRKQQQCSGRALVAVAKGVP